VADDSVQQGKVHSIRQDPDPHGQAALLLVESLIHGLIASPALTVAEAVEIVDVAVEVKADIAADMGESRLTLEKSLPLLKAISTSLTRDIPG
jgi:hypothetical protein